MRSPRAFMRPDAKSRRNKEEFETLSSLTRTLEFFQAFLSVSDCQHKAGFFQYFFQIQPKGAHIQNFMIVYI